MKKKKVFFSENVTLLMDGKSCCVSQLEVTTIIKLINGYGLNKNEAKLVRELKK